MHLGSLAAVTATKKHYAPPQPQLKQLKWAVFKYLFALVSCT